MKLYFQGGDIPTYRNLMKENSVGSISLSYFGLRRRTKFTKGWDISKYFPTESVFVDSGCATINGKENDYTDEALRDIRDHYYQWVYDNIERIEYFTEFDAIQLGTSVGPEIKDKLLQDYPDKFLPIWGSVLTSVQDLNELAQIYGRIGVLQTSIGNRDIIPVLNKLASKGIKLHGLSMTKPDIMKAIPWESVSSTSWVSPMQYGDTIIWSHNQLKRYPNTMKYQARKKERATFIAAGFDYKKIQDGDSRELLRVSLWSWNKLVESINNRRGVTSTVFPIDSDFFENESTDVGTVEEKVLNRVPTARPRDESEKRTIPFLDFQPITEKRKNDKTGEYEDVEVPTVRIRSESMRICDTCFLAEKCPMYEPQTTCAYDIPIQIRTKEQVTALMDSMVEMQAQRVLFMKMVEDAEGGMADPVLSSEIDRLGKLMKTKHDMEQEGFSLTVTAKQQGQISMVDRIFGDIGNTKTLRELEAPREVPETLYELGIIDQDFIDG